MNWSESWQRWLDKIPHLLGLTCSSFSICCVGQVTTVGHHNQSVLSARNKPLEMPLFQVFPLPRFFLCPIWVVKIQLIEVDVSCCWTPGEPQTVCHVSVGCLETNNWRWYWKKRERILNFLRVRRSNKVKQTLYLDIRVSHHDSHVVI